MRLGWFVALAASAGLVVGGIVGATSTERQLRDERDEQLGTLAALTATGVKGELARIAAVLETAPLDAPPASLAATLGGGVNICPAGDAAAGETGRCSGRGLVANDELVERALQASGSSGEAASAAGPGDITDETMVVAVAGDSGGFVAHVPVRSLLSPAVSRLPTTPFGLPRVVRDAGTGTDGGFEIGASSRGDRRVYTIDIPADFVDGRYLVIASADGDVTLSTAQRLLLTLLLFAGGLGLAVSAGVLVTQQRRLSRRAVTDDLTGLVTRRELVRRGQAAIAAARATGGSVAVVFVDLDGFKRVNDLDGHHVGDQVLAAVADRLRATVRDGDVIGRWGGDEFAVLLIGASNAVAMRRAAELCDAVATMAPQSGSMVTASAGVAVFPDHGPDTDALVRAADAAMYAAKRGNDDVSRRAFEAAPRRR